MVGEQGGHAIKAMIQGADKPGEGILGSALGVIMLLVGAAGLFSGLQDALNTIWGVQPKPGRGIWGIVRERFLSFSMVLGCAFLLLVSLVVSAALAAVVQLLGDWQAGILGHVLNEVVSLVVITLLFAMIFRFLPDAKIAWRDVWLGAVLTALLFEVGKFLIGLYLGHSSIASSYGAAGSLAVLLVWLYYSSQIFLFGAELTKAYADRFGSRIVPAPNAVAVTKEAKEGQKAEANGDGRAAAQPSPSAQAS
jgi:membrane protein